MCEDSEERPALYSGINSDLGSRSGRPSHYVAHSYMVLSIVVPIMALVIGLIAEPYVLAAVMVAVETGFSICLTIENNNNK